MKKTVAALTLGILFLTAAPARSDEIPYLEFVRALRAHNYNEEAIHYLQKLEKQTTRKLPRDVLEFIPLEKALCAMELAVQEPDMNRRNTDYDVARGEFEKLIKNQPNSAFAAIAALEKARIVVLQGRACMVRAQLLKKDEGGQKTEMTKALDTFQQAEADLTAANDLLDKQLKREYAKSIEDALKKAKLQAEFELVANQVDQATTYEILNKSFETRGKMIEKAITSLTELADRDKGQMGVLAKAWRGKANAEIDGVDAAKKEFIAIEEMTGPNAEPGKRQARYFHFMLPVTAANAKMPLDEQAKLGEAWLNDYPSRANTFEGNYVRFVLGNVYMVQGNTIAGDKPSTATIAKAKPVWEKAVLLYNELETTENEFKSEAQSNKIDIMFLISENVRITEDDINKMKKFDDLMTASNTIGFQIGKEENAIAALSRKPNRTEAETKELETKQKNMPDVRKKQLKLIEHALARALEVADAKTKPEKIAEARAKLAYVTMVNGDPQRAAVIGEHAAHLADQAPGSADPAKAAAYALEAYAMAIYEGTQTGVDDKILDSDRKRLQTLAEFMETKWKDAPETNNARYQAGTRLLRDKKYREAEKLLSNVTDRTSDAFTAAALADARYWWAMACYQLLNDKISDEEKAHYKGQAVKALKSVPETLPADTAPHLAQAYVQAKLMYGSVLYENKQFGELKKLGITLADRIKKFKLDDQYKDDALKTAESLIHYATMGEANNDLLAGNYKKARELVDAVYPAVGARYEELRKPEDGIRAQYDKKDAQIKSSFSKYGDPPNPEKMTKSDLTAYTKASEELDALKEQLETVSKQSGRFGELYRGLLIVGLRAAVLGDDPNGAMKIYFPLLRKAATNEQMETKIFTQIAGQMRLQIDELKKQTGKEAQLKSLQKSYLTFLKKIGEQADLAKKPEMTFFLVESYSSLDQHIEAADMLGKFEKPVPKKGEARVDPKEEKLYHYARLRLAKELRLAGKTDAKKFEECRKVIDEIQKQDWGKGLEPKKESAHLWHDQAMYGAATREWSQIIRDFGQKPNFNDARIKDEYFEAYYHFFESKYLYAKTKDDPRSAPEKKANLSIDEKRKKLIEDVAKNIVELDANQFTSDYYKTHIAELLKKEEALRKEVDRLKKEKEKEKAPDKAPAKQ